MWNLTRRSPDCGRKWHNSSWNAKQPKMRDSVRAKKARTSAAESLLVPGTWHQRIRRHVDVDRRSRFHSERSWESCCVIRGLYRWRGVRVGEASNPGPRRNSQPSVPGEPGPNSASSFQRVAFCSEGVPGSETTMVDLSGGSHSSVTRFAALSDPLSSRPEVIGADVSF